MLTKKVLKLKQWISESDNIVFFGGAGVSTESGIPDFRSADGLYYLKYEYPPETILSHSFFMKNTREFYNFYKDKMIYDNVKPNITHLRLADLEEKGRLKAVITQNIDGLHQEAGSKNVLNFMVLYFVIIMDCSRYSAYIQEARNTDVNAVASSNQMLFSMKRPWMTIRC